jgi:AbrB family looped-hinge helix DNA binding protein
MTLFGRYAIIDESSHIGRDFAMGLHVKVAPNGRLVLPAQVRQRMGLEGGGDLILDETEEGVVLRTGRSSGPGDQPPLPREQSGRQRR